MEKIKPVIVRNADELARALDLSPTEAIELEIRSQINDKIIEAVSKSGLTHAQVAKAARTSRPRLTAILNQDRSHVSTDFDAANSRSLGIQNQNQLPPISFRRVINAACGHTRLVHSY